VPFCFIALDPVDTRDLDQAVQDQADRIRGVPEEVQDPGKHDSNGRLHGTSLMMSSLVCPGCQQGMNGSKTSRARTSRRARCRERGTSFNHVGGATRMHQGVVRHMYLVKSSIVVINRPCDGIARPKDTSISGSIRCPVGDTCISSVLSL
jgi:hypothetical protein